MSKHKLCRKRERKIRMKDTFLSQIAFKGLFARTLLTFGETTPYPNLNCAGKERGICE